MTLPRPEDAPRGPEPSEDGRRSAGRTEDVLRFLGLIRRAGKLAAGEENAGAAVRKKRARLILLASDASPNAEKRAGQYAAAAHCPLRRLPADKGSLARATGSAPFAIAAVCDAGLAAALEKKLTGETTPGNRMQR